MVDDRPAGRVGLGREVAEEVRSGGVVAGVEAAELLRWDARGSSETLVISPQQYFIIIPRP